MSSPSDSQLADPRPAEPNLADPHLADPRLAKSHLRIVAMARAGASLTARLLDGLPGTACYPFEARFVGPPAIIDYPTAFKGGTLASALQGLGRDDVFRRVVSGKKLTKDRYFSYDAALYAKLLEEPLADNDAPALIDGVSRAFFTACEDFEPAWEEVTHIVWHDAKGIWSNLDAALRSDPKLKLLVQFRHPLEWLVRFEHMYRRRGCSIDIKAALSLQAVALANAIDLLHRWPGRVMFLRYEDVVADAGGEMRRVCAFAGIDYDEAATQPTILGQPWVSNSFLSKPQTGLFKAEKLSATTALFDPAQVYESNRKVFEVLGYGLEPAAVGRLEPEQATSADILSDQLTPIHNILHRHFMASQKQSVTARHQLRRWVRRAAKAGRALLNR